MEQGFRRTFWGITKYQFSGKLCPIAKIVAFESIAKIKTDNEKGWSVIHLKHIWKDSNA